MDASRREPNADRPDGGDDAALVAKTLAGDRAGFDELVRKYQRQAVAVSYRLLGDSHDAMEVTQDAFLKAYTSLGTLQTPAAFGGWLLRIVSNLSLNRRRGRALRKSQQGEDEADGQPPQGSTLLAAGESTTRQSDPVRELAGRELGERLTWALEQLPERQRLAVLMFTIDQLPQKQVAESLGCSVEAVKWHVFQGRKKLKNLLSDYV